ncbi:hypothetical protein KRX57_08625 [Weeksellaceae bacterium TAE3-ERU29]|nr:hypothetical protein [Weeksellaceae bacterium TAE3-ERU29]
MKKLFIIGFLIMMIPSVINAQLLETNELYPNTNIIKGKYYNGTSDGKYWSLAYVDSIGRIIDIEK